MRKYTKECYKYWFRGGLLGFLLTAPIPALVSHWAYKHGIVSED